MVSMDPVPTLSKTGFRICCTSGDFHASPVVKTQGRRHRFDPRIGSVQSLSRVQLHVLRPPWTAACQASLSSTPRVYSNSCRLSQWCHPTISSSIVPFSSCLQFSPASGSFSTSQFFTSGSQSTEVSASASVLSMNLQDWFPLRWTGWISLQSKGLSRVFSNTTVQKHQFFGAQLSLQVGELKIPHAPRHDHK